MKRQKEDKAEAARIAEKARIEREEQEKKVCLPCRSVLILTPCV